MLFGPPTSQLNFGTNSVHFSASLIWNSFPSLANPTGQFLNSYMLRIWKSKQSIGKQKTNWKICQIFILIFIIVVGFY